MKKISLAALAACVSLASAACFEFTQKTTGPSTDLRSLAGAWSSGNIIPAANTCTDFKWNVTEYTGTTAAGTFSATCAGDLKLVGEASGELVGSIIKWVAKGTATAPGLPSCFISLNGSARLKDDTIEVPYQGTTCLGDVSGMEVLRRR
ncbi:MAG TPA: hypothetical protein VK886_18220 [Vicinamibacterales bacterium]|nr:hypothetical protein [Vicinamibacterales bacterium]